MLCCVSRKASARPSNEINQRKNRKPVDSDSAGGGSSSGFSESSSASSGDFQSSGFSPTSVSSSSSSSGFSSDSRLLFAFANSNSSSGGSDDISNCDYNSAILSAVTPEIVTVLEASSESSSSSSFSVYPSASPKRLQTFSPSVNVQNNLVNGPNTNDNNSSSFVEKDSSARDEPPVLLPCAICARTFKPQSLEKHTRICERSAIKKRKPFDSAKQRIQGTDLAEFLPKETIKRKVYQEEKPVAAAIPSKPSWKQTHDEFLKAIRAARGETIETGGGQHQRQVVAPSNVTVGVPTRPNEKGMCPTCNRQFSIKAYERHVAWCKEHATRVPITPATNVAKERLEARMKYRAPLLKNRRVTNREKYSPGSAVNLSSFSAKNSQSRAKESASTPNCNNKGGNDAATNGGTQNHQKSTVNARRPGQSREGISSGPIKSRLSDRSSRGSCKDYDPFVLAERQMNELLSSDSCSERSYTDSLGNRGTLSSSASSSSPPSHNYPLSHSSAFSKYPDPVTRSLDNSEKRVSLIAPPSEFDDVTADFSSDSTETNSISREIIADLEDSRASHNGYVHENKSKDSRNYILGRRVIIDKSKALGTNEMPLEASNRKQLTQTNNKARKIHGDKITGKVVDSPAHVTRSISLRATSAPKAAPERKNNNNTSVITGTNKINARSSPGSNNRNNNYPTFSGSNMSLSSIVSSELEVKRSNSLFDELASSFEDDVSDMYPSLKSLLKNNSLSISSPVQCNRPRNGQMSDDELSSPDGYNKQEHHNKLSADSAYSSLNRKYSNHGRSTNDVAARQGDDQNSQNRRAGDAGSTSSAKSKLPKFCHECGCKFPETAKFCCECGIKRLAL